MNQDTKDVLHAIEDLSKLATDLVVLDAIWLDKSLQTARKRTIRITKGDLVRIEHERLVDCDHNNPPTHVILECRGTIYSGDLQVICEDLDTKEIITVKL